jgi:hypothetical protein
LLDIKNAATKMGYLLEFRQKLKTIVTPTIIWQGDSIRCAKTARTLQCKICMTERKEILHRFRTDKSKIMNDNSDIYSSCKCKGRFHRFGRKLHIETLRMHSPQKKVNSTRSSKPRRARFSFNLSSPRYCQPTNEEAPVTPEPLVFLINTYVPGLPWRPPLANLSNLELAQLQEYQKSRLEVVHSKRVR